MPNPLPPLTPDELAEARRLCEAATEPVCPLPGCGAAVGRPKCLFELASHECPRHELAWEWRKSQKKLAEWAAVNLPRLLSELEELRADRERKR